MSSARLLMLSLVAGGAIAQSTTSSPMMTATSSGSGEIQTVMVGDGGLIFSPSTLTADAGDQIEFHFVNGNHSVAQGDFANPCMPSGDSAFFSGFVAPSSQPWTLTINSSDTIWFYCSQGEHCQNGMVGVINAPDGMTEEDYANAAMNAGMNVSPSSVQGGVFAAAMGSGSSESMSTSMSMSMSMSTTMTMSASASSASMSPTMTTGGAAAVMTPMVGVGMAAGVMMGVAGMGWVV